MWLCACDPVCVRESRVCADICNNVPLHEIRTMMDCPHLSSALSTSRPLTAGAIAGFARKQDQPPCCYYEGATAFSASEIKTEDARGLTL